MADTVSLLNRVVAIPALHAIKGVITVDAYSLSFSPSHELFTVKDTLITADPSI